MRHLLLASLVVLGLPLVACGGAVDSTSSAASAPHAGGDERAEAGPAPMPMPESQCRDGVGYFSHACLPDRARAGTPLVLYAQERNGCHASSCSGVTSTTSCRVEVQGDLVKLSVEARTCVTGSWDEPRTCSTDCNSLRLECEVPPLTAGRYRVVTTTPGFAAPKTLDRELVVADGEGADACREWQGANVDP